MNSEFHNSFLDGARPNDFLWGPPLRETQQPRAPSKFTFANGQISFFFSFFFRGFNINRIRRLGQGNVTWKTYLGWHWRQGWESRGQHPSFPGEVSVWPLNRGFKPLVLRPLHSYCALGRGNSLTSLFRTSMSQRASARMEQASLTPQCAAACRGVQPSWSWTLSSQPAWIRSLGRKPQIGHLFPL